MKNISLSISLSVVLGLVMAGCLPQPQELPPSRDPVVKKSAPMAEPAVETVTEEVIEGEEVIFLNEPEIGGAEEVEAATEEVPTAEVDASQALEEELFNQPIIVPEA